MVFIEIGDLVFFNLIDLLLLTVHQHHTRRHTAPTSGQRASTHVYTQTGALAHTTLAHRLHKTKSK